MYCSKCGKQIADGSRFCAECGTSFVGATSQPPMPSKTATGTRDQERSNFVYPRNPPLSPHLCWLNLPLPGSAQILHGQVAKGIVLLVVAFVSSPVIPLLALAIVAVSTRDAFMVGQTLKSGVPVEKWAWFPKA